MDGINDVSANPGNNESVLHSCLQSAYKQCSKDQMETHARDFANASINLAKATALYVPGAWGKWACATIFAADEPKTGPSKQLAMDLLLGAGKGLALKSVNQFSMSSNLSPVGQGALLGVCSRAADVALTRNTYEQPLTHHFDFGRGTGLIGAELTNGPAFLADVAAFTVAHGINRTIMPTCLRDHPRLSSTMAGATFGLMEGAVSELQREQTTGKTLDYGNIVRSAAWGAGSDGLAATVGSRLGQPWRRATERAQLPTDSGGGDKPIDRSQEISAAPAETPSIQVTHSYSDVERALLYKFGSRLSAGDMERLPEAFDNISNRVRLTSNLHDGTLGRIYDKIDVLFEPSELISQVRSDGATIAKQVLIQVGNPWYVQQGDNPTCTVAALEHRMYARDPERAVDLILQALTTSTYVPAFPYRGDRFIVKLNPHTLIREHSVDDPFQAAHNGAYRSYASQIFQYVIPNVHWQSPSENSKYDRHEKIPHYFVVDYKTKPPTTRDFPYLSASESRDIYEAITGSARQFHFNGRHFSTIEHFKAFLERAEDENLLPLLLTVDARHQPFSTAHQRLTGNPVPQHSSVHDICLNGYDSKSDLATIYNPWGRQAHPGDVPLITLFNSLYPTR